MVLLTRPPSVQDRPHLRRKRAPWVYWVRRSVLLALVVFVLATGWSLVTALAAPGDDVPTKLAEWARDHSLGFVVTTAENVQYKLNPPVTGGAPDSSILAAGAHEASAGAQSGSSIPLQTRLVGPVAPAISGEGVFVPAVRTAAGPVIQVTYVRPDNVHTSYLTGVAWMSHTLRFVLHPGFQDPGTSGMSETSSVTKSQYPGLAATFNGGFKMKDAQGGYYDHGHTVGSLVKGAASLVIFKDGHATVGTWGSDVSMTSDVVFVRQNLKPLITGGVIAPNVDSSVETTWGTTVGASLAVWRSGIGVTANGDLVFAGGEALSAGALADVLKRAGAVTAMQLDINKAWVSFMWFGHSAGVPVPHKLGDFQRAGSRYLSATSRDFVAVYTP